MKIKINISEKYLSAYLYAWASEQEEAYVLDHAAVRAIKFIHNGNKQAFFPMTSVPINRNNDCYVILDSLVSFKTFCDELIQSEFNDRMKYKHVGFLLRRNLGWKRFAPPPTRFRPKDRGLKPSKVY
jgi:hypothetical protein